MSNEENGGIDRFGVIWRARYRIIGASILIAIVTFVVAEVLPKTYQSSATVAISLPPQEQAALSSASITAVTSLAGQYADTATLGPVLNAAAPHSGTTATVLMNSISAGTISGENLISVRAQAPSPGAAALRANAVANALTENINNGNAAEAAAYTRTVTKALAPVTNQIKALQAQIARPGQSAAALAAAESQLDTLLTQRGTVLGDVIQGAAGEPTASVLAAATDGTQMEPRPVLYTLVALLVGLLVTCQIAVLVAWRRLRAQS